MDKSKRDNDNIENLEEEVVESKEVKKKDLPIKPVESPERVYHHRRKRRKFYQRKRNLLSLFSFIVLATFVILFLKLNLIPLGYTFILIGILLIYQLISFFILNSRKTIFKILGAILFIISILVNLAGTYYMYNTDKFLKKSFNDNGIVISNTFYVVTSKSSGLTKQDIEGNVDYVDNNSKVKKAIERLTSRYDVELQKNDDITTMFTNVLNGTSKFMFIESSSYNIVFDLDKTFDAVDFVVLDEINVNSKITSKEKKSKGYNIYLGGTDFTYNTRDFNMILSVNMDSNEILLTSIPRDYYIPVYGREDQRRDTLSYMGPYGVDVSVGSLENYFGIDIDYYLTFNANNVVEVVDALGGINYCSEESFTVSGYKKGVSSVSIHEGCQMINGKQALSIARVRKIFNGGDRARQDHVRKIIVAMLEKLKDTNTVMNYSNILDSFAGLYDTTIPRETINELAQTTIKNKGDWKITEQSVNGTDGKDYVHLTQYKDWVMYPDDTTVKLASEKINELIKR